MNCTYRLWKNTPSRVPKKITLSGAELETEFAAAPLSLWKRRVPQKAHLEISVWRRKMPAANGPETIDAGSCQLPRRNEVQ